MVTRPKGCLKLNFLFYHAQRVFREGKAAYLSRPRVVAYHIVRSIDDVRRSDYDFEAW